MISFSLFFLLKRAPRIFIIIFLFIAAVLQCYLLLGCTLESGIYSSVYSVEFEFNTTSSMFPLISQAYKEQNHTDYLSMKVRSNYLGVCIENGDTIQCESHSTKAKLSNITGVSFFSSNGNSSINLIDIGFDFSENVIKPYVLIITLVVTLFLMLVIFYCIVPCFPGRIMVKKASVVILIVDCLLSCISSIWYQICVKSTSYLIDPSSMYIVDTKIGKKAQLMTWTSFSFITIVMFTSIWLLWRDTRAKKLQLEDKRLGGSSWGVRDQI